LLEHLLKVYPKKEGEKDGEYERAINARMFDILRAFLPAGTTTNLSWTSDLRQVADHLAWLEVHPDPGIRRIGSAIAEHCRNKYPSSFRAWVEPAGDSSEEKKQAWREHVQDVEWRSLVAEGFNYSDEPFNDTSVRLTYDLSSEELIRIMPLLSMRPRRSELPPWMAKFGNLRTQFPLDFGSFRDLQRHRNGVVRMPLLTVKHGFHPWYWDQMPEALREQAKAVVETQAERIRALDCSPVVAQYYCAMGFQVVCEVVQGLPAFIYRIELRTNPSVHPTLRSVTQKEAQCFAKCFPEIKIYPDLTPDTWDTRRGKQTILEKT
jgi:hypothetical protein